MGNLIDRIRAAQDQRKQQTLKEAIAFLENKIIDAARRGERSIKLNDFYHWPYSRKDLIDAYYAIGNEKGITISTYYVGEAGRAKHGDLYIHAINW